MIIYGCLSSELFMRLAVLVGLASCSALVAQDSQPIVIAHRGASGYLPEHSLPAKAMAYAMGADYLEQDLVMTKDDRLVVLHDHFLDRVTNVAAHFPGRQRPDGRFYVIDFTLAEIKSLAMSEGFKQVGDKKEPNFPQRFPLGKSSFHVSTFEEEIELVQGLNKSTGTSVGIYPEIKSPWFHRQEGKDISRATLSLLKDYGYHTKDDKVYLQCFDPIETKRIHDTLFPEFGIDLKLVQLIAETAWQETLVLNAEGSEPYDYAPMIKEEAALREVAEYADGIGPWMPMVIDPNSTPKNIVQTGLVQRAHKLGLRVHPYTFRSDAGQIPSYAESFDDLLRIFIEEAKIDGLFTDFPDKAVKYIRSGDTQDR